MIERRLLDAAADMAHWQEFDYVVVNDSFARALEDLLGVVKGGDAARRSARDRPELAGLTAALTAP